MRRRTTFALALLVVASLGFGVSRAVIVSAASSIKDLQINRTLTTASGGPFAGDHITVYGAGTFNLATNGIHAQGVLIHRKADGTLVGQGRWVARSVESFESYGTGGGGLIEGGKLVLKVTVFPEGEAPVTLNDFTVTCLIGSAPPGAEEGVTIPSLGFTDSVDQAHRFTLFENI